MKNLPVPENETERLKALKNYNILDTIDEHEFDRITELASLICETPIALVSLIDENRQWFKSKLGLEVDETPRDLAFCQYTIMGKEYFEIEDASRDERFKNNDLVTGNPHIRFYTGYPLIDSEGFGLGTLCVIDKKPKILTEKQKRALSLLADEVTSLIKERRQKQELIQFEKLFKFSNDLICIIGPDGYFQKINPSFKKVLGWDDEYILKSTLTDLIFPDDVAEVLKNLRKLNSGSTSVDFSHKIRTNEGEYKILDWVASAEPSTGNIFAIGRDITEEKRKEKLLQISEDRFRSFFENSQGLMCTHDLEGNFITVNAAGASLIGYSVEEIMRMNLLDIVPAEYHTMLGQYLKDIAEKGTSTGLMKTQHKNGDWRIWIYNNVLEKNDHGQDYVIGNSIDITEKYYLEADLKRTKELLEQTNSVARVGGWEVDVQNGKIMWTSVTKEIHGVGMDFKPDMATGINFYKEGENRDKITKAVNRAIEFGIGYDLELQIINAQGKEVWVRTLGDTEFENGKCKRLYGTFQDIDEKKRAEIGLKIERSRLAAFVEHAPAAVAMLDQDMRYIAISDRWLDDYKISGRDVRGLSHYQIFPNLDQESKDRHQRILNGAVEKKDEEVGYKFDSGDDRHYVSWEMRPWYQFNGVIGGIMISTQNITQIVKQREELKTAKELAEQASIAKSEFLASMSHEIRTPLNGVIGFTDLVLKTSLNTTQQQYLNIVNQSANALLSIINDILDFSKIEAGKLELDIEQSDLYEMASQAADIITYQAQQKGLEMLLNISPALPRFIWTDTVRLKQVLINLLSNAVKFTEAGEIELTVAPLKELVNGQTTLRFSVRDTGIGIKPDKQDKIFEAFAQEDGSTTKKYGGTGLGLTISNKLLALMGSRLELKSIPGKGSTFYFDLTLKAEAGELTKWENLDHIENVLIVDDNVNNRLILKQMLLLRQIKSEEATNGIEAIQALASGAKYDVILMDYHMPVMDGIETIRKIRENFYPSENEQPIILLYSSSDDEKVIKACDELKVNRRLVKPIKISDMYNALNKLRKKDDLKQINDDKKEITETKINILVVEDNPVNMLLAKTIVTKIAPHAHIIEAGNGLQAIEQTRNIIPDLILMDIQMPEMNGYQATSKIREILPLHVPIIALTAGNVKGEKEKCLEAGMDDFVSKPFVEEAIIDMMEKWLPVISGNDPLRLQPVTFNKREMIHFDIDVVKAYVGDDEDVFFEVLNLTSQELNKSIKELYRMTEVSDIKGIKAMGHRLYGTCGAAGLIKLAEYAKRLEIMIEPDEKNIDKLITETENEINVVMGLFDSYGK